MSSGGWGEEEERKPRPIGTERAWKLTAAEDWGHAHVHHQLAEPERYGAMGHAGHALDGAYGGVGSVGGGATAAALSLMHALPLHYLPPVAAPEPPPHWDPAHAADKQVPGPRRY